MIGKKGNIIQEILDKSKVVNVRVVGDDEAQTRKIDTTDEVSYVFCYLASCLAHVCVVPQVSSKEYQHAILTR